MVKKKLNIAFVAEVSHIGGASTSMEELANCFIKLGHNVFIIQGLDRQHCNWSKTYVHSDVIFQNYEVIFRTNIGVYLSLLWGTWKSLSDLGKGHSFDIVLLNGTLTAAVACLHPNLRRTKKIFLFHGDDVEIYKSVNFLKHDSVIYRIKKLPFMYALWVSQKIALTISDFVVCFSRYSQDYALKKFKLREDKLLFAYHGVNTTLFKSAPSKTLLRKKLGLSGNSKIILCTSRFEPRKGIDLLVESFTKLTKNFPDSFLYLATSIDEYSVKSDYYASLINKIARLGISSRTRILHNLTRRELLTYYQLADIHILPSKALESFPLVVLEALACATPVVCYAKSGGASEVVGQVSSNLIFERFNTSSLSKSISWGLRNAKIKNLGLNSLNTAKKFKWQQEAGYLLKLAQ